MSFTRNLSNQILAELQKPDSLFSKKLKQDILNQKVFLTIRNNNLDFYHKGGRLFKFDNTGYETHIKYAAVISKIKKDYLKEAELKNYEINSSFGFVKNYNRIKENCKNYAGVEAQGVSHLYHKYSCFSKSDIIVLDIEASLESLDENKTQDRIDILLYNKKDRLLRFVEAKHYTNGEIRSRKKPKVISQVKDYEKQIAVKKSSILKAYSNYIDILNDLFANDLASPLPVPISIDNKVTLLIFGFDNDQKKGYLTTIQKQLSKSNILHYSVGNIKSAEIASLWSQAK